jgi:hypothetical protein
MADTKISALTGVTSIASADKIPLVDATSAGTRHISVSNMIKNLSLDVRDFIHDDGSGTNNVISTMAYIPKFKSSGWPQSVHNGLELGGFWWDVYKCCQPDASSTSRGSTTPNTPGAVAACSRPGTVPWTDISWTSARIAASNRVINGRACHLVTPWERFAVLSWIMHTGNWGYVHGNNNNGKDLRDSASWENYGVVDPVYTTNPYRMLNGTGPSSWWSGGIIGAGVADLVGNVYEWEDCRIESGAIQPKAYLNGAVTAADTTIVYDDNGGGDGANIHQLTPGVYTITDAVNGNEDVTVTRVIITGRFSGILVLSAGCATDHGDNCLIQLKTAVTLVSGADTGTWKSIGKLLEDPAGKYMALPDGSDTSTHTSTYLDDWYSYNNSDSRVLLRCGGWADGARARSGLIVHTRSIPSYTGYDIGFRAALNLGDQ